MDNDLRVLHDGSRDSVEGQLLQLAALVKWKLRQTRSAQTHEALLERGPVNQLIELPESDEDFSWRMTQFLIWPGEHNPILRRQLDMDLAIRTSDDDLEAIRTS